ncbi:amino acid ABC transporter permease [Aminobacter aganoensis]|uniref:His/Glu/Gln/Arg/opine family amino acid ABC transporter permease subunit n=1 Tax=Aminobacter aganoensis TaxID=83264 RepID=A0A7X0FCS1_9HYPH|nr:MULTISPECIES: amino acid ABC transporter permease [Aminobacter]KQU72400.1 amino acid ABC transporter permease [Aminobacter sp. DSM 101952]MBB6357311.1 His/Glu/Gln/Arg/opine family amino acid ABC transporter permease subunit [Aminobacter aganoensis]
MAFDASVFLDALFSTAFLNGALITVSLALLSHAVGIAISIPAALYISGPPSMLRGLTKVVLGVLRGAPTLLQLLFVWNALPQFFPIFREPWFSPFLAAWIALSLNEAAYQTEINRAALGAIDPGQQSAGTALGMTRFQILRFVTLPQAIRVALPPTANEFITLLKITSLASVISLSELMSVTSRAVATTFQFTEYYAAALVYYLVMVYVLIFLQARLERRLVWNTSVSESEPSMVQKALAFARRS